MPAEPSKRRKTVNGVTRSLLLPRNLDERLNKLCEATGHNRNSLVKLFAAKMKPSDVQALEER